MTDDAERERRRRVIEEARANVRRLDEQSSRQAPAVVEAEDSEFVPMGTIEACARHDELMRRRDIDAAAKVVRKTHVQPPARPAAPPATLTPWRDDDVLIDGVVELVVTLRNEERARFQVELQKLQTQLDELQRRLDETHNVTKLRRPA